MLEADEDVDSLAEHPAVGGQGQVGHHSVQHSAPDGFGRQILAAPSGQGKMKSTKNSYLNNGSFLNCFGI